MNGKDNFLLDTNIILGLLKGTTQINAFFKKNIIDSVFYVSQITRMELLGYPNLSNEEEKYIQNFLSLVKILPVNDMVCDQAIILHRKTTLKLPDALIAATAIHEKISRRRTGKDTRTC